MHPWYRGFNGLITKGEKEKDKYKCTGIIAHIDEATVEITELPVRMWTQSYKENLEAWVVGTEKVPALIKVSHFFLRRSLVPTLARQGGVRN